MLERRHYVCMCVCKYIISAIKYEILIVTVFNYQMRFALNDNAQFEVKFIIQHIMHMYPVSPIVIVFNDITLYMDII